MQISNLRINGFKSFGPEGIDIPLKNKLSAFIGLNSSGKTTALEALRKLFGASLSERELVREDFHVSKNEDPNSTLERRLSIEAAISFSEDTDEQDAIAIHFPDMVIDGQGTDPYIRIRLEAKWSKSNILPDGEIEFETYYISVSESEIVNDENKRIFPRHLRPLIQVLYVPAIRKPSEQIKYASGSILYRILRKIQWGDAFKANFDTQIDAINTSFQGLPQFRTIQNEITKVWGQFHKDERYKDTTLEFSNSNFDEILKKLEISFTPTGTHKKFGVNELGDGYRSMFYLTLVCALLDIEEQLAASQSSDEELVMTRPLLTILAIEEPENHIAPQLLGRVVKILASISKQNHSQVLLSSHTPSIVRRIDPESILHFRITEQYESQVNKIKLPERKDEAYKYIKEAIHNYPEIYFARLVVIGEGDTEEVVFNRFMDIEGVDFDDNIITFAPLGHRFVNHIWKLLDALKIPHITLLDLDLEREGGGWGRIKYALQQLFENGVNRSEMLNLGNGQILEDIEFNNMHNWNVDLNTFSIMTGWISNLERYNVFFSAPLDLDFLLLTHYPNFYKATIPPNGGPRIPDKIFDSTNFQKKLNAGVQATLKSENAIGCTYTAEDKELMIWYNYHFLGRGKPTTHILTFSEMTEEDIRQSYPLLFHTIFERIKSLLLTV